MAADSKSTGGTPAATATASAMVAPRYSLELVAGAPGSSPDHADGPLLLSRFHFPMGLCLWRDQLLVADSCTQTVRSIEGVVTVPTGRLRTVAGLEDGEVLVRRVMKAVRILPRELAAIVAGYRVSRGVRTVVGALERVPVALDGLIRWPVHS
jgi:hypothetical protein